MNVYFSLFFLLLKKRVWTENYNLTKQIVNHVKHLRMKITSLKDVNTQESHFMKSLVAMYAISFSFFFSWNVSFFSYLKPWCHSTRSSHRPPTPSEQPGGINMVKKKLYVFQSNSESCRLLFTGRRLVNKNICIDFTLGFFTSEIFLLTIIFIDSLVRILQKHLWKENIRDARLEWKIFCSVEYGASLSIFFLTGWSKRFKFWIFFRPANMRWNLDSTRAVVEVDLNTSPFWFA